MTLPVEVIVHDPGPRRHSWKSISDDFVWWKCEHCGFEATGLGPPDSFLKVVYKQDGVEYEVTCEEIEDGIVEVFHIHDS